MIIAESEADSTMSKEQVLALLHSVGSDSALFDVCEEAAELVEKSPTLSVSAGANDPFVPSQDLINIFNRRLKNVLAQGYPGLGLKESIQSLTSYGGGVQVIAIRGSSKGIGLYLDEAGGVRGCVVREPTRTEDLRLPNS